MTNDTPDLTTPTWEYAPAPQARDVVTIDSSYGCFIDGEFVDGHADDAMKTINPATEEVLAEVVVADEVDVANAVAAARRAQEGVWSSMSGAERGKYLFRLARLLQERAREFAVLESLDNGKPIRESRDVDVPTAAAHLFHHAGWADRLEHAGLGPDPRALGVAGQVIPWNFPLLMLAWKVAPALACGNTVVLKPAETTPLTALRFAELCQQADLPPGVVNILPGAGATGAAIVAADVDKVAFTGSTAVGKEILRRTAGTDKRLTLELGGKAANIVFDDAAIDQAVEGIVDGIFFNQGHVCCAGSRLLVQENIHDEVVERLQRRLSTMIVGDPLDKNTDIGAINSPEQLTRIVDLVDGGTAAGATMWQPDCDVPDTGYWFRPTVFTGVETSHAIAREEIFGPVLSVLTFRTPDEALDIANRTPYGLSAGVWTEKGSRILWMADRLRAGVVWANTFNRFDPTSPFGGYKESGFGREGGRAGLAAYLDADESDAAPPTASASAPARPERDDLAVVDVRKTYKLTIGGAFPRSESGRTRPVHDADGTFLANVPEASRKDARDAVVAARKALAGWSGATAYNRGQVLYRVAEMLEGRTEQFVAELVAHGASDTEARDEVRAAVDRWVWYAGWTDKIGVVAGSSNPVAGPFFNFSTPEPTGVVALVAPDAPGLLGLVDVLAPVLVTGNTAVVLASRSMPLPALSFGEVVATSDVPGGVVNVLTADVAEVAPHLAGHLDVNAIDLAGVDDADLAAELQVAAADNVKRVRRPGPVVASHRRILDFTELKTVWHPAGR